MGKAADKGKQATARVFWSGRSQAVRLPKAFRFAADEVIIRKEGDRVILEPLDAWGESFWSCFGALSEDFDVGERDMDHERDDPFT